MALHRCHVLDADSTSRVVIKNTPRPPAFSPVTKMDIDNWQANRIRNSRYLQDGTVKPWPWGIQVQILGAEGCGRHSVLNRVGRLYDGNAQS